MRTTLQSLWDLQTTFMKDVEAANSFAKFVGLVNNFWKVCKTRQKLYVKFADWKVRFKCLKVFLYLSFTCSNILIGKHKCFVNTFQVSWIFFTNKLNCGHFIQVGKIFGTVVGRVRQVVIICSANTTKYYLGGLMSGSYGEVVVL